MKNILASFFFLFCLSANVMAQTAAAQIEQSDPAATAIFQKVRAKYEAYETIEVDVAITIEIPEQPKIEQKGNLVQKGDQYRFDLPDQLYISDGNSLWYYSKTKNQVQLNSIDEDDEDSMMTPKDLLRVYEREDFFYALTNEYYKKNITVQQIELKPRESGGEYKKLRVEINKKTSEILSVQAFFSDGVRYKVAIDKMTPNPTKKVSFKFNGVNHPGVKVEDLRID